MIVDKIKYPNILAAFHASDEDNSGPRALKAPLIAIPDAYEPYAARIESAIAGLSRTERAPESPPLPDHVKPDPWYDCEFYTFVAGEHDEMWAITNRSMDLTLANVLLTEYFEDFEQREDPYQMALQNRIQYLDTVDKKQADELRLELK